MVLAAYKQAKHFLGIGDIAVSKLKARYSDDAYYLHVQGVDVLDLLGISATVSSQTYIPQNKNESIIMSLISQNIGNPELLQHKSILEPTLFNSTISCLEINGAIIQTNSGRWILA